MVYQVIPRGSQTTAISYDGTNFLEVKRYLGDRVEQGNKTLDRDAVLLVDSPYGVQKMRPGDVVVKYLDWWHVMSNIDFYKRYEIFK